MLGANDGIVSTASLVIGVAAANSSRTAVLTAGHRRAGRAARCRWPPASTSRSARSATPRRPTPRSKPRRSRENRAAELRELAKIYEDRGVEPGLARLVAEQLMAHDELGAHMRDELGITEVAIARPFQAAWTSAVAFTAGALLPLLAVTLAPSSARIVVTAVVALRALVGLGVLLGVAGGARVDTRRARRRRAGRRSRWP